MERYLGIYSNGNEVRIEKYNFDNDIDLDNLRDTEYEQAETIEELEKNETEMKFLHIYENENDIYRYTTTKIIK